MPFLDSLQRKVMVDFRFSDGLFLPAGTYLVVNQRAANTESAVYENPNTFDGYRFYKLRQEEGESVKHQYVNTSMNYLPFGHGKHSW